MVLPKGEEKIQGPPPPNFSPSTPTPAASSATPSSSNSGVNVSSGKKSNLKKILLFIFSFFALLSLGWFAFRRFSSSSSPKREVTITFWGLWEPLSVMEGVIADFEKENPKIKVSYQQQSLANYRRRLQSALVSESGPDLFLFHNTWVPMLKDNLLPLSFEIEDDFYPVVKESLYLQGRYYGLPYNMDTLALFYNKDLLSRAQASPPKTWDDFRQLANKLTVRDNEGRIRIAGAALGEVSNVDHWSDILGLMLLQNGAKISGPYQEAAEQALQFFIVFSRQDHVWDDSLPASTEAFAGGKLAMYFAPSWRIINVLAKNPNLNFGVAPVPQLPQPEEGLVESSPVAWASFWAYGLSNKLASSEKRAAAEAFLKYLSRKETRERIYKAGTQTHYVGALYPQADMAPLLKDDPLLKPFLDQATYAKSWYLCSRTGDEGINSAIIKYFEDSINRLLSGEESQLETTVSTGVAAVLKKYGAAPF